MENINDMVTRFSLILALVFLLVPVHGALSNPIDIDVQAYNWVINNHPGGGREYVSVFEQCRNFDLLLVQDRFGFNRPRKGWWFIGQDQHVPGYVFYRRPQATYYQQIMTGESTPH